jgi:hypothetical protein
MLVYYFRWRPRDAAMRKWRILLRANNAQMFENNLSFLFLTNQARQSTKNMDEIQVVAVVAAPEPKPVEVCPVKGGCPICCFDFEDGEKVVVMGCQGRHIMHTGCYEAMAKQDQQHQRDTYAHTLREAVRRHEGASDCPVCRQMSHCCTEAVAMIFYSGKTVEEAIVIKDDVDDDVMDVDKPETYPWDLPNYPWVWANPEDYDDFFDDDGDDSDWTESDN